MIDLAVLLLAAVAAPAEGSSAHRFPLDAIVAGAESPRSGELLPIETWLRERLPRAIPEVGRIAFVHSTRRRFEPGESAPLESTLYEMEVEGKPGFSPEAVRSFLARLAERSATPIRIHATIVERPVKEDAEPQRAQVTLLDEFDWRHSRADAARAAESEPGWRLVKETTVDVAPGAVATLTDGVEISYISDFDLQRTDDALIADPVIATLRTGALVVVTPIVHPDGETLTLEVVATLADTTRPMKTIEITLAGNVMTRQVPEVRQLRWESGPLDLPLGKAQFVVRGLLAPPVDDEPPREVELYMFVRPAPAAAAPATAAGRVIAFDTASGVVVAILDAPGSVERGRRFETVRDGEVVGAIEVERLEGDRTLVCRRVEGSPPRAGDLLR